MYPSPQKEKHHMDFTKMRLICSFQICSWTSPFGQRIESMHSWLVLCCRGDHLSQTPHLESITMSYIVGCHLPVCALLTFPPLFVLKQSQGWCAALPLPWLSPYYQLPWLTPPLPCHFPEAPWHLSQQQNQRHRPTGITCDISEGREEKSCKCFHSPFSVPPREATSATFETVNKRELLSVERLSGWSQKRAPWHSLQMPAQGKV